MEDSNMTDKKSTPTLIALFLTSTMLAIGVLGFGYDQVIKPSIKPDPVEKIFVSGTFPFDRGWTLLIEKRFYTDNPTCKHLARVFFFVPVAEVSRELAVPIEVTRHKRNEYSFQYHDDYLAPGFCEWKSGFVAYQISHDGQVLQRGAMIGFPIETNRIDYVCRPSRRPVTKEVVTVCLDKGAYDKGLASRTGQVNFLWEGIEK
jgi:hypothetical protein